ncbi:TetR/AcrR family transcriptional regulator [Mycolicibacter longobardus]|nr:TetR/AcrR family transcriptional regulator [Mycolicibacter longobardus]
MTQVRMPGPQRRDQILDACRAVVDNEGFHAVNVDRIAKLCGITRPVIYQQFGGLTGMLVALVDRETFRAGRGFFEGTGGLRVDPTIRARDVVAGVLAAVDADPATWRMFLMPSEGGPPELYERLAQSRSNVRTYLAEALMARAHAVPDTDLTVRMIHAACDEIVRLRLTAPDIYTIDRLLAQVDWLVSRLAGEMPAPQP